ncbi:MAG: ABC transporter, partial [Gammaproteobacteria bacterium]|nr:ABC transporter [Gammaproteobacteria bacterium]
AFATQTWQIEKPIKQLLNERRWWFRSAGPAQLLLILRAFQGITQQLNTLGTSVSWSAILLQNLSSETLQQARDFTLPALPEEQNISTRSVASLANTLKVRVLKNGKQTVNVTLPAEMFLEIETLIPEDVLALLAVDNKIDIAAIKQAVLDSGLAPQAVFSINNGEKEYSVWLE